SAIAAPISFTLAPRESRPFEDLFAAFALAAPQARAAISCEQAYYAYALRRDRASGAIDLLAPEASAARGALTAAVPECSPAAECFDAPGVDHVPTTAAPVGRV